MNTTNLENNNDISNDIKESVSEEKYVISDYIKREVSESQILVAYLSRYNSEKVDKAAIKTLIESNYMITKNIWGPEQELKFWDASDKVACTIKPVTIESLKATMPNPFDDGTGRKNKWSKNNTDASRSVIKYRLVATFALILLLLFQVYWINGSGLISRLGYLFKEINTISFDIEKNKLNKKDNEIKKNIQINKLNDDKKELIQEFGATYLLLQEWNRLWQSLTFRKQFNGEIANSAQNKYEKDIQKISKEMNEIQNLINLIKTDKIRTDIANKRFNNLQFKAQQLKFDHEFDKERNELFLTKLSAEVVVRNLQVYVLPLLYGLLGAIIFTLRNLAFEIKNLTYTRNSETRYSLRITMGLLGGVAIGWFLKPDDLGLTESLSPMTLSFLIGYNVEILFSIMDKFLELISKFSPSEKITAKDPKI